MEAITTRFYATFMLHETVSPTKIAGTILFDA